MSNPVNLIGSPIPDIAMNQLAIRANLKASTNQSDVSVNYKAKGHNAFAKLTSFVKITDDALAKAVHDGGTNLAEKWCLFNGIGPLKDKGQVGSNGSTYNFKSGTTLNGYGQGGVKELGVRPMPGIISVQIDPAGANGSVRRGTVKFKCHNMEQLNIIDVLYFRFGFSMLLEWGHTMYPTNDGSVVIANTPIDVFGREWTKEELHQELEKRRLSNFGNYDGMLGLVTNYEWSATQDGGYECTLYLTGIGGVIESLKINSTYSIPVTTKQIAPPNQTDDSRSVSQLNSFLLQNQYVPPGSIISNNYDSALASGLIAMKNLAVTPSMTPANFKEGLRTIFFPGLNLVDAEDSIDGYKKGFNAGYMSGQHAVGDVDFNKVYTFYFQSFEGAEPGTSFEMAYIPLSLLLAFINNSCLAYNKGRNGKNLPLVYIDFNPDTNKCFRLPGQISIDPGVCLLDNIDNDKVFYKDMLVKRGVNIDQLNPPIVTQTDYVTTKMLEKIVNGDIAKYQDKIETRGNVMNILVNIDHILETLHAISGADTESNVFLTTFLDKLMTDIARVTGNINNFSIAYDDVSNVVRIYDQQLTFNEQAGYPTFPVFGLSSVVRTMSLKTNASPAIGSMFAIQAMAGERSPTTPGADGSAFTALNNRLEDRMILERTLKAAEDKSQDEGLQQKASTFVTFRNALYEKRRYKSEDIGNNINFYCEAMNTLKANRDKEIYKQNAVVPDSTTAKGILPIEINVTMDGISTIKMREGFTLPHDRLPAQYKNGTQVNVGFVISGMSHTIQGQSWITAMRGQMVNIPSQKTKASGEFINDRGIKSERGGSVTLASGCKSSYGNLPVTNAISSNTLTFADAVAYLKRKSPKVGKAVFTILFAESNHEDGPYFTSAGGFNYGGVQTDAGLWGGSVDSVASKYITNQFCRRDSGGTLRMFAVFESNEKFLDFMINRVTNKGFSSFNTPDQWTSLYIRDWWSPADKKSIVSGTVKYNQKLDICKSAYKRYV